MKKLLVSLLIAVSVVNITKTITELQFEYLYSEVALNDVNKLAQHCKQLLESEKEELEGRIASAPCRKTFAKAMLAGALLMSAASLIPGVGLFSGFPCVQMCGLAGAVTYGEHMIDADNKEHYEQVKQGIADLSKGSIFFSRHTRLSLADIKQIMVK